MPRATIERVSTSAQNDPRALMQQLQTILSQLEVSLANNPNVSSRSDGKIEPALRVNDPIFTFRDGVLKVGIWDGKRPRYLNTTDLQSLQSNNTNYVGHKTGTPVYNSSLNLPLFPEESWGFYQRTAPAQFWLVFNLAGVIKGIQLT